MTIDTKKITAIDLFETSRVCDSVLVFAGKIRFAHHDSKMMGPTTSIEMARGAMSMAFFFGFGMSVRPFSFSNWSRNMMYLQHKRRVRVQAVSGDGDTDSPGGHVWFPPGFYTTTVSSVMLVDPAGNIFLQHIFV
jgi:hypothetical protein